MLWQQNCVVGRGGVQPYHLYSRDCQTISDIKTGGIHATTFSLPGQNPEEDDTLVSSGLSEGVRWRGVLIVSLREMV